MCLINILVTVWDIVAAVMSPQTYIGAYPLEKMIEYNANLLHDVPSKDELKKTDRNSLIEMLKGLSDEEKKAIVSALSE